MNTKLFFIVVIGWCMLYSAAACEDCREIACSQSVRIKILVPSPVTSGTYSFTVTSDGNMSTCFIDLPLASAAQCSNVLAVSLTASPQELTLDVASAPSDVSVVVTRDGTEITRKTFRLTYVEAETQGPNCASSCRIANPVELSLPAPLQSTPCEHDGYLYQNGEQFSVDCNICTCHEGSISCTEKYCGDAGLP